jgi:hypothetical protein
MSACSLSTFPKGSGEGHVTKTEFARRLDPHPAPEPVIGPAERRTRWAPPSPFQGEGFEVQSPTLCRGGKR